ncbi:MAG: cobalamin biosynthesis protein CobD [Rhizobiales bacterium]|nr:cobalamin biosynthesis protein CobD [Hyphomicrobiales bacterium]
MPDMDLRALLLILAILLDWLISDPKRLYSHILHPVQYMGEVLSWIERRLNKQTVSLTKQKLRGVFGLFFYLSIWLSVGIAISLICNVIGIWGMALEVLLAAILLSGRSLYEHVRDVNEALKFKTIEEARLSVGQIVGRDVTALDERGVARAAIESGAENLSDGFIAPVLFYFIAGLPGLIFYKAVNTADSMIGHKTQRFLGFGWAAARFDDLLNWVPARLTGFLIMIIAQFRYRNGGEVFRVMMKDHSKHSSPNAGWPESAMAGALGIALAGPRVYFDVMKQDPWINAKGRLDTDAEDIWQALAVMKRAVFYILPVIGLIGASQFLIKTMPF